MNYIFNSVEHNRDVSPAIVEKIWPVLFARDLCLALRQWIQCTFLSLLVFLSTSQHQEIVSRLRHCREKLLSVFGTASLWLPMSVIQIHGSSRRKLTLNFTTRQRMRDPGIDPIGSYELYFQNGNTFENALPDLRIKSTLPFFCRELGFILLLIAQYC